MPPRKVTKIALYDNNGCPNLSSSHDAGGRIAKNRNTATTIGWMIVESSLIAIITTNSKTAKLVAVRNLSPLVPSRVLSLIPLTQDVEK